MINKRIETFLEHTNMNYMFCLLSNLEVQRMNSLPPYVKQKFEQKITEIAMDHVAQNEVPDYMMDIEEARAEMEKLGISMDEFDAGIKKAMEDEEDLELETELEDFQGDYKPSFSEEDDDLMDDDIDEDDSDSDED
ncbi:MAG: hypothetical protein R6V77_04445 [Candidatus Cloacimonadaceae bacterium]